ncbi:M13 family metallopeptidase [Runella salmonicolor]|uniref:M13 family metallopeptidase n=1 Tax=Runella salmonicolor TaxID=2950278 RepID=A0ABT1FIN2_9BACT|nr:M13 family metallopeptidase [Runella salmonicolor]MCP1381604.1 M13 family metallopeptidase [Runella salmonicolor]
MKSFTLLFLITAALLTVAFVGDPKKDEPKKAGLDLSAMDKSVRPQDDFFRYVNGTWLKTTAIPASETGWGTFSILQNETQNRLKSILENTAQGRFAIGSVEQRVGDFYAAGMDSLTIEKRGYAPIKPVLAEIEAINDYKALLAFCASHPLDGGNTFITYSIFQDARNPTKNVLYMAQAGTGLPDKDYYTKTEEATVKIRNAYKAYISQLFVLTGTSEAIAQKQADEILALETQLAASHLSSIELRDLLRQYNKVTLKEFSEQVPNLALPQFLTTRGAVQDTIIIAHPNYYRALNELLTTYDIQILKAKLRFSVIASAASLLSAPFVRANFDYNKVLTGRQKQQDRWKRILDQTDGAMGDLLGQLYVKRYFKPEAKQRMMELVGNLKKVFRTRLESLDWMTAETKAEALKKLESFTPKIGYPDKWKTYEGVVINRTTFYENVKALQLWHEKETIARLNKPIDKTEWRMTPQTINAYYNPLQNEIVFPAGILQWPCFDIMSDDAVNYGAIGAVIGHEMTHGFDDQGRLFNYMGMLKNWWKKEDNEAFKQRSQQVVDQYNGFRVLEGLSVKGELTLGENIADLGGLSIAYEAFPLTSQAKQQKKLEGFTPNQRFFMAYAQVFREKVRDETLQLSINTNPHSPAEFRANGPLSNFEPFYQAFDVKQGDKLYRENRTKIW